MAGPELSDKCAPNKARDTTLYLLDVMRRANPWGRSRRASRRRMPVPLAMTMAVPIQIVLPCRAQWRTLKEAGHELTCWQ